MLAQFEWFSPNTQPCLPSSNGEYGIRYKSYQSLVIVGFMNSQVMFLYLTPQNTPQHPTSTVFTPITTHLTP